MYKIALGKKLANSISGISSDLSDKVRNFLPKEYIAQRMIINQ